MLVLQIRSLHKPIDLSSRVVRGAGPDGAVWLQDNFINVTLFVLMCSTVNSIFVEKNIAD